MQRLSLTVMVALLCACGSEDPLPTLSEATGVQDEGLVGLPNNTNTNVFQFNGSEICTATLISPWHFVTATHCIHQPHLYGGLAIFHDTAGQRFDFEVAVTVRLGLNFSATDVALGFLAEAVPPSVAQPAELAVRGPTGGHVVRAIGFGPCTADDLANYENTRVLRRRQYDARFDSLGPSHFCDGDSGGPFLFDRGAEPGKFSNIFSAISYNPFTKNVDTAKVYFALDILWKYMGDWHGYLPGLQRPVVGTQRFVITPDAFSCANACTADGICRAYNYEEDTDVCRFLAGAGHPVPAGSPRIHTGVPYQMEWGYDRPGNDLFSDYAPNEYACQAWCANTTACQAWVYDYDGRWCWLKSHVPSRRERDNTISGVRRGFEHGVDRPGSDTDSGSGSSPGVCASLCAKNTRCRAFSWIESEKKCVYKDHFATTTTKGGITSAVRGGIEPNLHYHGSRAFNDSDGFHQSCQTRCANDVNCRAWTKVGLQCFLRDDLNIVGPDWVEGAISGRKGMEFF